MKNQPSLDTESLAYLLRQLSPSLKPKLEKLLAKRVGLQFREDDPIWSESRRVLITGGIRAGKSTRGAFKAFKETLNPHTRLIWLVGPDYQHAQEEFRMVLEWLLQFQLVDMSSIKMPSDGSRSLRTVTGCLIETRSAQHSERLASVAPDGIVLCEPGQMSGEIYDICLGRLSQRRGWLFMVGTLEDDLTKPRWAWYEDLAIQWANNPPGSLERSYAVPTWYNTVIYPHGLDEPELQDIKERVSEYKWWRMYGGRPMGVENPVFPMMWEPGSLDEYMIDPDADTRFVGGAIGVDYGRTFEHPSAVVVVQEDDYGRFWCRYGWTGIRADINEIVSIVKTCEREYGIYQGAVDPNQAVLGELLGYMISPGGATGGKPSEIRISLVNGLLENRMLYFEKWADGVDHTWESMRKCARIRNTQGELVYNRPKGDDLAQALMYAVWLLRGTYSDILPVDMGEVQMRFQPQLFKSSGGSEGRI